MGDAAIAAARALDYVNAGTVEFIVGPNAAETGGDFFFMEINTRLQVEHPVTELVTGLDLVELQLRVAAGEALPASLLDGVRSNGHAIELRLYAEDPQQGFLPGSGKLHRLQLPQPTEHVRIDAGVIEGDTVTIFYDPMIAKLIVWDQTRSDALQRMREALAQCDIIGPKSNIDFLERLVRHPAVVQARIDTGYLDRHLDEFLPADIVPDHLTLFAAAAAILLDEEAQAPQLALASGDPHSPWSLADAWRIGHSGKRIVCFSHADQRIEVDAHGAHGSYAMVCGDARCRVENATVDNGIFSASFDGILHRYVVQVDANRVLLHDGERRAPLVRVAAFAFSKSAQSSSDRIRAPMPGRIVVVKVKSGDAVTEGQELIVMEAMKMEITLKAPAAATVAAVNAVVGEFVEADAILVQFDVAKS